MGDVHRTATYIGILLMLLMVLAWTLVIVMASGTAAAAQSQDGGNSSDGTEGYSDAEIEQRLDSDVVVLDTGIEDGIGWVQIQSDVTQRITVTDGGGLMAGGRMDQSTVTVPRGEPTRISVDATRYKGFVGVSISTRTGLYGQPIDRGNDWLSVPEPSQWLALLTGSGATFTVMIVLKRIIERLRRWGWYRVDG
jgi:hypothetical protein